VPSVFLGSNRNLIVFFACLLKRDVLRRVCKSTNIFLYRYWAAHHCPFWIRSQHSTPAQSDALQFGNKESAANTYYYRTAYNVNASNVGSNIKIVGVNVVSKAFVVGAPAVCAQAAKRIDLFINGTDGAPLVGALDGTNWERGSPLAES